SDLATNCNNFHLVTSGDSCSVIETQYGIGAADFGLWNPLLAWLLGLCGRLRLAPDGEAYHYTANDPTPCGVDGNGAVPPYAEYLQSLSGVLPGPVWRWLLVY
ncbi:carbohydrate-binding module family 50 protein, partial [Apiospora marii]